MSTNGLEVAIIGMAGRFPDANNIEEFWHNLKNGVESIRTISDEYLRQQGVNQTQLEHPQYVKSGGILENIDLFDANFFGINPQEAEILDPQQRLFLECAWEALETAGYDPQTYQGAIGIYAGTAINSYLLNLYTNPHVFNSVSNYQLFLASDKDFLTTRVSYKLNLTGPSVDIQTACSTSLVAVHIACQSLLSGECDLALAGGVAISKQVGYTYQEGGIYSPDGHCRAFDAKAQGTVAGSGLGIVVLKRLENALADGDCIQAIIKGSAINNDGALKVSYTAPSIDAQAQVIRAAQMLADVAPETITYIEAHGTGTPLGDPIEIAALTQVFGTNTAEKFCGIGSVKTNIGHLDTAAGIASLIKTVLALKHEQIPASLHFDKLNPQISRDSPFYINTTLSAWETDKLPRRAGVSSFGIGGTNAHVILEAAANELKPQSSKSAYLLCLSAKTRSALETATKNLANYLQQTELDLADVAYTLQVGRQAFTQRRFLVCQTTAEAIAALTSVNETVALNTHPPATQSITFLFPGQGSQYVNMGRELYAQEPAFRSQIDECCELLKPLGIDLGDILYPDTRSLSINDTIYAQPALFVVEYALAKLLMTWGIQPQAMLGHSIGEYVAACLAGVFSLADALKLVTIRGRLMQQQPPGTMLSVWLSATEIQSWLTPDIALAASNAPNLCVVSGNKEAISQLEQQFSTAGVTYRRLHTSHAFHSPMMTSVQAALLAEFKTVRLYPPKIPFISNVTGTWITAQEATNPAYWAKHLRETVQFSAGITELTKQPNVILLEVGPGNTLTTLAKAQEITASATLATLPHPQLENQSDIAFLLNTIGKLWLSGIKIDWNRFWTHERRYRVPLPTYPFERQRYWVDAKSAAAAATISNNTTSDQDWFYIPTWQRDRRIEPAKIDMTTTSCWLIFTDDRIGKSIAQQLVNAGHDVITVIPDAQFTTLGYRSFGINPQQPEDYTTLLQDLAARELNFERVVHLWSIDADFLSFYSLLFLTQAIARQQSTTPIQITIITNCLYDVIGTENLNPATATVLGLAKVINQEYPHVGCNHIDLMLPDASPQLSQQLLIELTTPPTDFAVAYRGAYRWRQQYHIEHQQREIPLRSQGSYVIVGDINQGLGKVFVEYLATISAKITIISDQIPPQCEQALGIVADITDSSQLQQAIAQAEAHFGTIHGVFYSTPMSNADLAAPLIELTTHQCEANFRAKVYGLYALQTALQGKTLDFCLLQSSLSTIVGGIGLGAYAAANTFIDTFAHQQAQQTPSIPWRSVNWDACLFEPTQSSSVSGANIVEFALTPQEVWQATQKILAIDSYPQMIVSKGELENRIKQSIKVKPTNKIDDVAAHKRPNLSNAYIAPRNQIEQTIANIWQDLLGINNVGIHDNFFELGGHSLLAIQAIAKLRTSFQIELPMRSLLFEAPTVAKIAAVIVNAQPPEDELAEMADVLAEIQTLTPAEIEQQLTEL